MVMYDQKFIDFQIRIILKHFILFITPPFVNIFQIIIGGLSPCLKDLKLILTPSAHFVTCCGVVWGCSSAGRAHDWQS
jgi:hypothetical protein